MSVTKNGVTTQLGYDSAHPDRLISYGGKAITYDATGRVSTYDGYSYTWTRGKLVNMSHGKPKTGMYNYVFHYNGLGQRIDRGFSRWAGTSGITSIQTGDVTYSTKQYRYDQSGRLIAELINEIRYGEGEVSKSLKYLYDESGMIGVQYTNGSNTNTYYYLRNLQGDVIGIYNTSGTKVVGYTYDAWGNCTIDSSTTNYELAHDNPIRYRGYYYDTETSWYFLNARYYSPEWRRFISPDDTAYLDPENVNGLNLYCYCGNDPINYADPSGHKLEWLGWLIGGALIVASIAITIASLGTLSGVAIGALAVTGAITGGVAGALNAASTGGNIGQGMITGALVGIAGAFSPLAGGLMATGMSLINDRINNENFNLNSITKAIISGVTAYTFSYGSAELANLMLANGGDALLTWTAYGVSNFIFASHNFATDTILYHVLN